MLERRALGVGSAGVAHVDTLEAEQLIDVLAGHARATVLVAAAGVRLHTLALDANLVPRAGLAAGSCPWLLLVVSERPAAAQLWLWSCLARHRCWHRRRLGHLLLVAHVRDARFVGVARVSGRTDAVERAGPVATEGILAARVSACRVARGARCRAGRRRRTQGYGGASRVGRRRQGRHAGQAEALNALVDVHATGLAGVAGRRHVSLFADAQSLVVAVQLTAGVRAALSFFARMSALGCLLRVRLLHKRTLASARLTNLVLRTVGAALAGGSLGHAPLVGVARVARRAAATEGARRIRAQSAGAAPPSAARALVNVQATDLGVARVSWRARATERAGRVVANSQLAALTENSEFPIALVDVLAVAIGVASVAARTVAPVGAGHIGADGSLAAESGRPIVGVALVYVDAAELDVVGVESESWLTHAGCLFAVGLAGGVLAAVHSVAGRLAAHQRVAVDRDEALVAGALEGAVRVEALAVLAASTLLVAVRLALVQVATLAGGRKRINLLVARLAVAPIRAVRVVAESLQSAQDVQLRRTIALLKLAAYFGEGFYGQRLRRTQGLAQAALVHVQTLGAARLVAELALAGAIGAERVPGAVVVARAANVDGGPLAAHIGRASGQEFVGTGALVAAGQVETLSSRSAGSVWSRRALVDVDAPRVGVASVAALTGALIGAGRVEALAIETAGILPKALVFVCCCCCSYEKI